MESRREDELTTKYFVTTLSRQDHLNAHSLDLPAEEVHRGTSSYSGDIISLKVVDDFRDGIETFLNGKVVFVVNGTEEVGRLSGSNKIGCTGETDSKRMELGPRSEWLLVTDPLARSNSLFSFLSQFFLLLSELVCFSSGDGSNQTGVKTT